MGMIGATFPSLLPSASRNRMSVIVDDRDSLVQYIPGWRTHDLGRPVEFRSTTSSPGVTGDKAEFTFDGSSVSVFGTVGPGTTGSSMTFSVDGGPDGSYTVTPGNFNSTIHHQLFWSSPVLSEGLHTLLITSSQSGDELFLDYLLYNTTSTAGKTIFVDDSDSGVEYSSGWQLNNSDPYFQHTTHFSGSPGSWFSFTFEGTALSVHGPCTTGPQGEGFQASVVLDGSSQNLTPPAQSSAITTFNNLLFTSPALSQGSHTINITVLGEIPLFVDYFLVSTDSDATANSFAATTAIAPTTIPSTMSPVPIPTAGAQSSLPLDGSLQSGKSSHVAAIVGGTIGTLVFLVLLLAGILLWRRRSRRQNSPPSNCDFLEPSVSRWAGKGGHVRDSMATLTNFGMEGKGGSQLQEPRPGSRYLYYPET
ncbi:hypothetical protein DFH09DRAFT_1150288 [Mycena vulgaris]|nr:hypothetical protein DFH09DRAFT_1150288 [Mycena vulgaris]